MRLYYRPGHPKASEYGFVGADDAGLEPDTAIGLQLSVDLNYSNLSMQDGEIVNSRRQHKEYMSRKGLAVADDFKGVWAKRQKEREAFRQGDFDHKQRREDLGRALYNMRKP